MFNDSTDTGPDMFRVIARGSEATAELDLYNPFVRIEGAPNSGKRAPLGQIANEWSSILSRSGERRNKFLQHGTMHEMPRMLTAVYSALADTQMPPFSSEDMISTARLTDQLIALAAPR